MPFSFVPFSRQPATQTEIVSREDLGIEPLPTLRLTLRNPGNVTLRSRPSFMRARYWKSLFLDARDRILPDEGSTANMNMRRIEDIFNGMQDDLKELRDSIKDEMKTMSSEEQLLVVEFWKEVHGFLLKLFAWLRELFAKVLVEIKKGRRLNTEVLRDAFNDALQVLKNALNGASGIREDGSDDEEDENKGGKKKKKEQKEDEGRGRDFGLMHGRDERPGVQWEDNDAYGGNKGTVKRPQHPTRNPQGGPPPSKLQYPPAAGGFYQESNHSVIPRAGHHGNQQAADIDSPQVGHYGNQQAAYSDSSQVGHDAHQRPDYGDGGQARHHDKHQTAYHGIQQAGHLGNKPGPYYGSQQEGHLGNGPGPYYSSQQAGHLGNKPGLYNGSQQEGHLGNGPGPYYSSQRAGHLGNKPGPYYGSQPAAHNDDQQIADHGIQQSGHDDNQLSTFRDVQLQGQLTLQVEYQAGQSRGPGVAHRLETQTGRQKESLPPNLNSITTCPELESYEVIDERFSNI